MIPTYKYGRVALLRNTGEIKNNMPQFESPVHFKQKAGYVRFGVLSTPFSVDWNKDGLMDLIMLDHEGYLAFFERFRKNGELYLKPGKRIFIDADSDELLRLKDREAGSSGRRKICLVDWDGDGKIDLLANGKNVEFFKNMGSKNGMVYFKHQGDLSDISLPGHSTSPTTVHWEKDGKPDLLIGAEDGHFYYLENE